MDMTSKKIKLALALIEWEYSDPGYIAYLTELAGTMEQENETIAVLLKDILVKTKLSISTIRELFGAEIADAVALMQECDRSSYLLRVNTLCQNPITRKVELAELEYKMDTRHNP